MVSFMASRGTTSFSVSMSRMERRRGALPDQPHQTQGPDAARAARHGHQRPVSSDRRKARPRAAQDLVGPAVQGDPVVVGEADEAAWAVAVAVMAILWMQGQF